MLDVRIRHRWPRGEFALEVAFRTDARCCAIHGPSGAGKSTLLACIAGLVQPDEGHVKVGDRTLLDTAQRICLPPHQRRIGLVFQDSALFPLHTVRGNLSYGDRGGALQLDQVAELLEIGHLLDRRPRNLSGGERQRVALGRALLSSPDLLLADEPFSALDGPRRDRLIEVVRRVRDELGVPLVLVTHHEQVVEALADEVVRLEP